MSTVELDGDKQRKEMKGRRLAPCWSCKHWRPNTPKCRAYPEGIPRDIFILGFNHQKPFPGDGGIRYEQQEDIG